MSGYILRRVGQSVIVLLIATLLIYWLTFSLPGDPVAALFGEGEVSDAATIARIREEYRLDRPFLEQYLLYLVDVFTLNFGISFSGRSAGDALATSLPITFQLALLALVIEVVLGLVLGVISGIRRGGWFDGTVLVLTLIIIGVPTFVAGFVLQFVFGVQLGWVRPTVGPAPGLAELLLPAFVLALGAIAYIARLTRSTVAEQLTADHVKSARARGLSETRIAVAHVLRNALIPVVTFIGVDFGALLGGSIIVEAIFNVPGIGQLVYQSILKGETAPTVSFVTFFVAIFILVNLVVDLLYAVLNPKVRYA